MVIQTPHCQETYKVPDSKLAEVFHLLPEDPFRLHMFHCTVLYIRQTLNSVEIIGSSTAECCVNKSYRILPNILQLAGPDSSAIFKNLLKFM